MAYFSLFYENQEQENAAKKQSQSQVYYRAKQKTQKKAYFVGSRMVMKEEAMNPSENMPSFFQDLNLEAVFLPEYEGNLSEDIRQLLFSFPQDIQTIIYRQEIYQDLDKPAVYKGLTDFRNGFTEADRLLNYRLHSDHPLQQGKYYLDAAVLYYQSIYKLYHILGEHADSAALTSLLSILKAYLERKDYCEFCLQAESLKDKLEAIYCTLTIAGNVVKVSFERSSEDFSGTVQSVFRQEKACTNPVSLFNQPALNQFENRLMSLVEKEYPKLCKEVIGFTAGSRPLIDATLIKLYKESEFFLSGHRIAERLKEKGFTLTYPDIQKQGGLYLQGICDIKLALSAEKAKDIALNDLVLQEGMKGAFITGANQGGKTTFARSAGQAVYLAMLGMPVIANKAQLCYFGGIYTHFTVEENQLVDNGKLLEELHHLKEILVSAPGKCLYILNEMFSSTTAADTYELTSLLLPQLLEKSGMVLCVTHVPELAEKRDGMASLIAAVREEDGYKRNYKIEPGEAVLSARAIDIALKYHLSGEQIKERMSNGD